MTSGIHAGRVALSGFLLAVLAGCSLTRTLPVDEPSDSATESRYVRICVSNDTDYHLAVRVYGASGAALRRIDVRALNGAGDSVLRSSARGKIHFGVEAVGVPGTYYPSPIQDVLVNGRGVSVVIRGGGTTPFSHSAVVGNSCS